MLPVPNRSALLLRPKPKPLVSLGWFSIATVVSSTVASKFSLMLPVRVAYNFNLFS
jgi:hypothetical protein